MLLLLWLRLLLLLLLATSRHRLLRLLRVCLGAKTQVCAADEMLRVGMMKMRSRGCGSGGRRSCCRVIMMVRLAGAIDAD